MRLWSQSDLAREAGVATSTISNIETGKAPRLRPSVMRKIAKALDIKDPMTVYELRIAILGDDSNEFPNIRKRARTAIDGLPPILG
jgi:transcriptional regulator with XRE-family HTH domain